MTEEVVYIDGLTEISGRVSCLAVGQTYTLRDIAGCDWPKIKRGLGARALGKAYARLVRKGIITHSELHSIDASPRQTVTSGSNT